MKITTSLLASVFVLIAAASFGDERMAQLSSVSGSVQIERSTDGSVDEASQRGPRVVNGSIYGGDTVRTGADSTAKISFPDGSSIELKPGTELAVATFEVPAAEKKSAGRKLQLLAGDIFCDITKNARVATEVHTPSGVAAIKGTQFSLAVKPRVAD